MRDSPKLLENFNNSTETNFELNKSENIIIRIETSLMVLELYKGPWTSSDVYNKH